MKSQRYAHAKQFRGHRREVKFLRTRVGRMIRDIDRKTAGDTSLEGVFRSELALACRVRAQQQRQVGPKIYLLHAHEWNASIKASRTSPMSSAARSRWQPPTGALRAAGL
jgi:IS5 family transposase